MVIDSSSRAIKLLPDRTQELLRHISHIVERIINILDQLNTSLRPLLTRSTESPSGLKQFKLRILRISDGERTLLFGCAASRQQPYVMTMVMNSILLQKDTRAGCNSY